MKEKKQKFVRSIELKPLSTHIRITFENEDHLARLKIVAIKQRTNLATLLGKVVSEVLKAYED